MIKDTIRINRRIGGKIKKETVAMRSDIQTYHKNINNDISSVLLRDLCTCSHNSNESQYHYVIINYLARFVSKIENVPINRFYGTFIRSNQKDGIAKLDF